MSHTIPPKPDRSSSLHPPSSFLFSPPPSSLRLLSPLYPPSPSPSLSSLIPSPIISSPLPLPPTLLLNQPLTINQSVVVDSHSTYPPNEPEVVQVVFIVYS